MVVKRTIISETQKLLSIYGIMTERQIYYKLISNPKAFKGWKSGKSFSNYISRVLCYARRKGIIDPSMIVDTSREIRYARPYPNTRVFRVVLEAWIQRLIDLKFSMDVWKDQKEMPIIILEKFALAEIFEEITRPYAVPLIVNRGFTSDSKLFELKTLLPSATGNLVFQVYSDYDTSGGHMVTSLNKAVSPYISNPFRIEKGALDSTQIQKYSLPMISRTYKKRKNKQTYLVTKQICEMDSLDPKDLKQIIKDNIEKQINDKTAFQNKQNHVAKMKVKLKALYP
jgi:hypothetical protein